MSSASKASRRMRAPGGARAAAALALLLILARAGVADESVRVRALTVVDGLAHNTVYAVLQDRTGFIWLGTESGLDRYDGTAFRHFGRGRDDSQGLSGEDLSAICEDHTGVLWIGVWGGGVNRFDPLTERFEYLRHDPGDQLTLSDDRIYTVLEDSQGRLWVATYSGLNLFDRETNSFRRFHHDPSDPRTLAHDRVWDVCEAPDGSLWVGTEAGLDRFDPEHGVLEHHRHAVGDPGSLSHSRARVVLVDRSGALWVGTQDGLNRLEPETGAFARFLHDPAEPDSLPDPTVTALFEDRWSLVWVGGRSGALSRVSPDGQVRRIALPPGAPNVAIEHEIEAITADASGALWIATRGGGLRVLEPRPAPFAAVGGRDVLPHPTVLTVAPDAEDGGLWVGTPRGVSHLMTDGAALGHFSTDPVNASARVILAERESRIWVGTDSGLGLLDPRTGRCQRYRHEISPADGVSSNRVLALLRDRHGTLWVGSRAGLDRLLPGSSALTCFPALQGYFVRALTEARDGVLWVGTEFAGLFRLEPESGTTTSYRHRPGDPASLADDRVFSIHEDPSGTLWIGTGHGLSRLDPGQRSFVSYSVDDGLAGAAVTGVIGDDHGRLWISTNSGISRLDPDTGAIRSFGLDDGLGGLAFSRGAVCRGSDGRLYFGGLDGLCAVDPDQVLADSTPPRVVLTDLAVFGRSLQLDRPFHALDRIDLAHGDHTFTLELAALDFTRTVRRLWEYRLEGLERDWITATSVRTVRYTNVPPGRYVFRARAASRDGAWGPGGLALTIRIAPPLWHTWWFRALTLVIILTAVGAWYSARARRFRRLESLVAERTDELRRLNAQKDEFLGIAAHDLRSPLAAVTSTTDLLLHLLEQGRTDPGQWRRFLGNIRTATVQMRELIDELLDVAAIETGRLKLKPERFALPPLLDERCDLHLQAATGKGIELTVEPPQSRIEVVGDRARVAEVLDNLVTNAIKFTGGGGAVRLSCDRHHEMAVVHVADTGQGLRSEELEHAFTGRKLSARPTAGESSTGLGLVIVRKIVELHGGQVSLTSAPGQGSTFSFTLPRA